jgi:hypothetical protein
MYSVSTSPAFYSHFVGWLIMILSLILIWIYNKQIRGQQWIHIVLLLSIAFQANALLNMYFEQQYNFNPLLNKWG